MTHISNLFHRTVSHVIDVEGGYVNDPSDRGGETKYGISKRSYPQLDIAKLTLAQATDIYHKDYWLHYRCDLLPSQLAVFLFDGLVNHRPKVAIRLFQMALKVTADGYLGPRTIAAAVNAAKLSSYAELVATAFAYRADFYHDLIIANSDQDRFALGWFKRLFELQQFIDREL